ncbi:MAG TPA: hypothetical protein VN878_05065 [Usitatibacter sp.]|nr:hypothetical protein [Usitatibacter sp.]
MTRGALGCALIALALQAQAADPVAFVADLRGSATIEGDGRLAFLAELAPGVRLLLGSDATVAVTFASTGTEFTLHGPGGFLVAGHEVKAEKGANPTRRTVMSLSDARIVTRVSQTATASLRMRRVQPAQRPGLEYPVDTRVATLQPVLRWRGEPAMEGFTVSLADASGKEIWKASAMPGSVRPSIKLAPASRYSWTVMSAKGPVGEARFETLPAELLARAEKSRISAKSFSDRVLYAIVLQDVGAAQDAREVWTALARERPDLAELAVLAR